MFKNLPCAYLASFTIGRAVNKNDWEREEIGSSDMEFFQANYKMGREDSQIDVHASHLVSVLYAFKAFTL